MNYFLLALSVCANVAYSSFYNYFGKKAVKERSDNYRINMCIYSVAAVILVATLEKSASKSKTISSRLKSR